MFADAVQAFLPVLLALHEFISHRPTPVESDEPEDMWGSVWEDLKIWVVTSPLTLLLATAVFSFGACLGLGLGPRSTYFCSALLDQRAVVVALQWIGIAVDAAILIMLWRVLSWARTTRARLRVLCGISLASAVAVCVVGLAGRLYENHAPDEHQLVWQFDALYLFDIIGTGITLGVFATSTALWLCESTPLVPTAVSCFIIGTVMSIHSILSLGSYQQVTIRQPLISLSIMFTGFTVFLYASNMRSVIVFRRAFLVLLLMTILTALAIFAPLKSKPIDRHPVDDLMYKSRVEADRWLRRATISNTLRSAANEYKIRYQGRDPPPNFDKWFDFAQQRESVVVDNFDQIEKDILPFRGMNPQRIRDGLEFLAGLPDVGVITIAGGKAHYTGASDPTLDVMIKEALSMISGFSEHLADMSIAINLSQRPRVLVPWEDIRGMSQSGSKSTWNILPSNQHKRQLDDTVQLDGGYGNTHSLASKLASESSVSAQGLRHSQGLACPPGSPSRAGIHWNMRDFCAVCADPHSQGEFLRDWQKSLDLCHQPDIFNLHEFYTTPSQHRVYRELLPLFSRSKTNSFDDILIPLVTPDDVTEDDPVPFDNKIDLAFWQGSAEGIRIQTHQTIHGGHRQRLVHAANNASSTETIPMILGIQGRDTLTGNEDTEEVKEKSKKVKFHHENVRAQEINAQLPLSFSFTNPGSCDTANCRLIESEFGFREDEGHANKRYVVLLDTPDGPAPSTLATLRSNSVPVVSTIFRAWYTERLMPWLHFVPVDPRYHGLHSTLAYFVGLKYRGRLNGATQVTESRKEDARWIAEQGRKWAGKALRREDMEVYLFRLLLEWGRVVDDNRDNLGFVLEDRTS